MESLTFSLILAAVSGLGFLAYKHPKAYRLVALGGMVLLTLLYAGTAIWDLGADRAYLVVMHFIPIDREQQAYQAARAVHTPRLWVYVIFGFVLYLQLLRGLPVLLEYDKDKKHTKDS